MTQEDLPALVLPEAELADLAGVPVDAVENSGGNNPKAEEQPAAATPESCDTFVLGSAFDQVKPEIYLVNAFRSYGREDADLGTEMTTTAAAFASPSIAEAKFEDIRAQISNCAEYQLQTPGGAPVLIQVSPSSLDGLTLPSIVLQRKAVVSPGLQAEGYGVTIAETYFLFRNTVTRATVREISTKAVDMEQFSRISLALQQHLLSLS